MESDDQDRGVGARAIEAAEHWRDRDWEKLTRCFSDSLRSRLGPDQLHDAWKQMQTTLGAVQTDQGIGPPSVTRRGRLIVVDVPLAYEHGPTKVRTAYDPDGRIAGFFVLDPGVP